MIRWEYVIITLYDLPDDAKDFSVKALYELHQDILNDMGFDGWEAFFIDAENQKCYMKRSVEVPAIELVD